MITDEDWEQAEERGRQALRTEPRAVEASYDPVSNRISVRMNWGFTILFPPSRAQAFYRATPEQLSRVEVDGAGSAIFFPLLDDGIRVISILEGRFGNDYWEAGWTAANNPGQLTPEQANLNQTAIPQAA